MAPNNKELNKQANAFIKAAAAALNPNLANGGGGGGNNNNEKKVELDKKL